MRIDVHNHALPRQALELMVSEPAYGVSVEGKIVHSTHHVDFLLEDAFTNPAAKLDELRLAGLEGAVLSFAPPLLHYHVGGQAGEDLCTAVNEGLAEFCAYEPGRLRWMAHIPMQDPARAAAVLTRAAETG